MIYPVRVFVHLRTFQCGESVRCNVEISSNRCLDLFVKVWICLNANSNRGQRFIFTSTVFKWNAYFAMRNNRVFGKKEMHSGKREIQIFIPFISVALEKRLLGMLCRCAWYFIDYNAPCTPYILHRCPILFAFDQHFISIFVRFTLTNI